MILKRASLFVDRQNINRVNNQLQSLPCTSSRPLGVIPPVSGLNSMSSSTSLPPERPHSSNASVSSNDSPTGSIVSSSRSSSRDPLPSLSCLQHPVAPPPILANNMSAAGALIYNGQPPPGAKPPYSKWHTLNMVLLVGTV